MENNSFLSLEDFKVLHNVSAINVKRNKETGKLFAVVGTETMRVQQSLDPKLPMTILVSEGGDASDLDSCCLVNYDPERGAEVVFSI